MSIFKKKSFESVREFADNSNLKKHLGVKDLILIGLGAIIGTGVFVLTGMVAAKHSGPGVMVSYAIAGIICIFVALAYAELSTMLPTSGSIYTYSYVLFGELFAWIMGGIVFLELGFGAATVSAGWSAYVVGILKLAGISLPDSLSHSFLDGGIINLPAVFVTLFVTLILCLGTKESKALNNFLVIVKLVAIIAFVIAALPYFKISNWDNFFPFGFDDVLRGGSILFFAYTGFNVVAATAEECKNPKKDITIGIIGSLLLSTTVYIIVAGLLTGIAHFSKLDTAQPLSFALSLNGSIVGSAIVSVGIICGMFTVLMMQIFALSRIFYVIARDGLMPQCFSKLDPKHSNPTNTILLIGITLSIFTGLFPYKILAQISSMGSLIDFGIASLIVMIFRIKKPNATRPFKCPAVYIVGMIGFMMCSYLLIKQIFNKHYEISSSGILLILSIIIFVFLYYVLLFFIKKRNVN